MKYLACTDFYIEIRKWCSELSNDTFGEVKKCLLPLRIRRRHIIVYIVIDFDWSFTKEFLGPGANSLLKGQYEGSDQLE